MSMHAFSFLLQREVSEWVWSDGKNNLHFQDDFIGARRAVCQEVEQVARSFAAPVLRVQEQDTEAQVGH